MPVSWILIAMNNFLSLILRIHLIVFLRSLIWRQSSVIIIIMVELDSFMSCKFCNSVHSVVFPCTELYLRPTSMMIIFWCKNVHYFICIYFFYSSQAEALNQTKIISRCDRPHESLLAAWERQSKHLNGQFLWRNQQSSVICEKCVNAKYRSRHTPVMTESNWPSVATSIFRPVRLTIKCVTQMTICVLIDTHDWVS